MARQIYEQPSPVRILPRNLDELSDAELELKLAELQGAREAPIAKGTAPKRMSDGKSGEIKARKSKGANTVSADDAF